MRNLKEIKLSPINPFLFQEMWRTLYPTSNSTPSRNLCQIDRAPDYNCWEGCIQTFFTNPLARSVSYYDQQGRWERVYPLTDLEKHLPAIETSSRPIELLLSKAHRDTYFPTRIRCVPIDGTIMVADVAVHMQDLHLFDLSRDSFYNTCARALARLPKTLGPRGIEFINQNPLVV